MGSFAQTAFRILGPNVSSKHFGYHGPFGETEPFDPLDVAIQWLYQLEESDTVLDKTENELNALIRNSGMASFDGSADFVSTPIPSNFSQTNLSYSVWLYPTVEDSTIQRVILRSTGTGVSKGTRSGLGLISGEIGIQEGATLYGETATPLNTWTHILAVREGTAIRVYKNGVLAASDTGTFADADSGTIDIGVYSGDGNSQHYRGGMCAVGIYDTALGLSDAQALYAGEEIDAEAFYPFNDNSGLTLDDISGNGRDATAHVGAGGQDTLYDLQNVYHLFPFNGGTKALDARGTTEILIDGLVGTEDVTTGSTGTATLTASAGKITVSGGYVSDIYIDGTLSYRLHKAYGTVAVAEAASGWTNAEISGGAYIQFNTLADGSDDTAGLGILNPPASEDFFGNNGINDFILDDVDATLLTKSLFSDDGLVYRVFSYSEMYAWVAGTENIWPEYFLTESGLCAFKNLITTTDLTPEQALGMIARQGSCGAGHLVPWMMLGQTPWVDVDGKVLLVRDE